MFYLATLTSLRLFTRALYADQVVAVGAALAGGGRVRSRGDGSSGNPAERLRSRMWLAEPDPGLEVGGIDKLGQGGGINFATRPELHVPPALARSLQQPSRIFQQRT